VSLNWIIYALAVALLFGVAALASERAAHLWRWSTRWVWTGALAASVLLPLALLSQPAALPAPDLARAQVQRPAPAYAAAAGKIASQWVAAKTAPATARADSWLKPAWMALSATVLLTLVASALMLAARQRRWRTARIGGVEVLVAPDAGPAVVGLLRPRIVVPLWLTQAPARQQALVLAHEQAHLAARDPQLLCLALLALVAMPWNLPLWWQLRRLRHAIEVDCDARVLAAGYDRQHYGEALIDVCARQSGLLGSALAMAESRSFLEQRIRIMVSTPGRWHKPAAVALAVLAFGTAAMAAQLAQPEAARHQRVQLAPTLLAEYEGVYQTDEFQAMKISVVDGRLMSETTGRPPIPQFAESRDHFFEPRYGTTLRFNRNSAGKVVSLTVTLLGVDIDAPRVDGAALAGRIAAHLARDGAMPGGEAALRRGADSITTGKYFPEDLTPTFAKLSQAMLARGMDQMRGKPVGKMQSVTYLGMNRDTGEDIYRVQYEKRALDWYLTVHSDGKVANARAVGVPPQ
jgi:hypothetical protein